QLIVDILRLPLGDTDLRQWNALVNRMRSARESVTVGVTGKYVELEDSYKSLNEALVHGGFANNLRVNLRWIESEDLMTSDRWEDLLRSEEHTSELQSHSDLV